MYHGRSVALYAKQLDLASACFLPRIVAGKIPNHVDSCFKFTRVLVDR
jgi:hypothetical protein